MAEETTAAVEEERELASQPIPGLVRKYTIITGQGMLAQIIMVVLEGLVMGWGLGAHGLACVSIIMSVEYINLAFGNLFGTGVPAVVGNLLGAGDIKGASKAFSQGFWLTTIVSVLLAVVMAVFTEPICAFFGATPDIMTDTVAGVRTFSVLLPDQPGELLKVAKIVSDQQGNIIKLEHNQFVNINRQSGVELRVTLEAFGHDHKMQILQAMRDEGYQVAERDTGDLY